MKLLLIPLLLAGCGQQSEVRKLQGFNKQLIEVTQPKETKEQDLYQRIRDQSEDPNLHQNIDLKLSKDTLDMKRRQAYSGCSTVTECPN